jgi:murein DD-endopeptidase MepM/ murein hydrolase activator NlpD
MSGFGDRLRRLFRERQIYLYSDGRVRTVVLSGRRQALLAGAALVVGGGVIAGACAAGAGLFALASHAPVAFAARAPGAGPGAAAGRPEDPRALGDLARTVQRRDAALGALLHTLQPAGAKPPGPAALATPAKPERMLDQIRGEQERLVAAAETLVHAKLERLQGAFRTARIDPAAFGRSTRPAGEGGPFIDASDPKALARALDVDPPFAAGVSRAASDAVALRDLTRAADEAPLGLPVDHPEESSGFGVRADPFTGRAAFHPGQDFRGAYGQPIHAAAAGVVSFTGQRNGYGNVVEIDHGHGFLTRYGHLSAFKVQRGEPVAAGQLIAAMGSTGRSTGVHLHYEVWQDGRLQNPDRFIKAARSVQQ